MCWALLRGLKRPLLLLMPLLLCLRVAAMQQGAPCMEWPVVRVCWRQQQQQRRGVGVLRECMPLWLPGFRTMCC
jgi:hypothetical protein